MQLTKGISSVLQKSLGYFNESIVSTSFVPPFPVCLVICCLNFNRMLLMPLAELSITLSLLSRAGSSLQYCHKRPDVFE